MKPIIVNLFAGPGAGKSTAAAGIFFELKTAGVNCELVREYAKDKTWERNQMVFTAQEYIFGKQNYRQKVLEGQVDVIVTDSPILLSALYNRDEILGEDFNKLCCKVFHEQHNMNYFIKRVKPYNPAGRHQDEAGAKVVDEEAKTMLDKYGIQYKEVTGDREGMYEIVNDVLEALDIAPLFLYGISGGLGKGFMVTDYQIPEEEEE